MIWKISQFNQTIIIIIIIIRSCRQHWYPWPSLATSPYRSSPLAGLQGYIPYPHRAAVCMFELAVLLLLSHMWGSIGVCNVIKNLKTKKKKKNLYPRKQLLMMLYERPESIQYNFGKFIDQLQAKTKWPSRLGL